jgi:hypothetical protein
LRAKEAEKALETERSTRRKLIDDEGRRDYVIPYHSKCEEVNVLTISINQLKKQNTIYSRLVKELHTEKSDLVGKVDTLTTQRASLSRKLANRARRDAVDARASMMADRQQAAALAAAAATAAVGIAAAEGKAAESIRAAEVRVAGAAKRELTLQRKLDEAEAAAAEAEERASDSKAEAESARAVAMDAMDEAAAAQLEKDDARWAEELARRREARAKAAADKLACFRPPMSRTDEERAELSRNAGYAASKRDRDYLQHLFTVHNFQMQDLSAALAKIEGKDDVRLLDALMDSPAMFAIYFERVDELRMKMERDDFGIEFGLMLHYDFGLTLPKILEVTQVACKTFHRATNNYKSKVLLHNSHIKNTSVKLPRIAPPTSRLAPVIKNLETSLWILYSENGRIAYKSFADIVQTVMMQDPGTHGMPPLPAVLGGALKVPLIVKYDATGFGTQQLTTLALHNPYMPQAAQQLRIMALGRVGDDRGGVTRLLGPNLDPINSAIRGEPVSVEINCETCTLPLDMWVTTDVSALRHSEHLAGPGWCGCNRDFALRTTPVKPASKPEMHQLLTKCVAHDLPARFTLSHSTHPGEEAPRPCTAPGCSFAHSADPEAELAELLATEAVFSADESKAGKARFSKWRMQHASSHLNVQPGLYGKPFLHHPMKKQILDPLHYAELGLPKTPWKKGLLDNASDDGRALIAEKCAEWKHPIDTRRKDDNATQVARWFTGAKWATFCRGKGDTDAHGTPGGPKAIAELVMIIGDDLLARGVSSGSTTAAEQAAAAAQAVSVQVVGGRGGGRGGREKSAGRGGRSRAAFSDRHVATAVPMAQPAEGMLQGAHVPGALRHVPTALELRADPADLETIRAEYGSRAQTLLNTCLAFDGYFEWYYPLKYNDVKLFDSADVREERAFDNCRRAIDMHEIMERLSIRHHKSFLFHAAIYKVTADILLAGDLWAFSLSSFELNNAETKCVASSNGARRLELSSAGTKRCPLKEGHVGPAVLAPTVGYGTTMVISTMKTMAAANYLRRGGGIVETPDTRVKQRFTNGTGRVSLGSSGPKLSLARMEYDPRNDTCVAALARRIREKRA